MIYNLANSYKKLKKYNSTLVWFCHGINLQPRWIDGLCGLATTYFNMKNFKMALKFITLAKENYKGSKANQSLLDFDTITFLKAVCLKMTGSLDLSSKTYASMDGLFKRNMAQELVSVVWGVVLTPLSDDRKLVIDHFQNLAEIMEFIREVKLPKMENKNLFLTKYCHPKPMKKH